MGVQKIRGRLNIAGPLTLGPQGRVVLTPSGQGLALAGTLTGTLVASSLRVPAAATAITANALGGTAAPAAGQVRLGRSAGTIQIGVVVDGTPYVFQGTAGGAVTLVAAP